MRLVRSVFKEEKKLIDAVVNDHKTKPLKNLCQIAVIGGGLAGLAALWFCSSVLAQYPVKPVKWIVPIAAGGPNDIMTRAVAVELAAALGQPVVIENRAGAGGSVGTEYVARSPADGYTVLMATTSTHAILPVANAQLPYDAQRDFVALGLVAKAPNVLVVSPSLGVTTVKALIELARSKPGQLSFASSGNGTITHLVSEAFNKAAGIQATHVPYKTGVQALSDMVSGAIAYQFDSITWTLPQAKAGKIRALAIRLVPTFTSTLVAMPMWCSSSTSRMASIKLTVPPTLTALYSRG